MNLLDVFIVFLNLIEIILVAENILVVFRYIRFITAFKILRLARLFKEINFLHFLFLILKRSLSSFIYLAMLFLLLNFVYALTGMQLFGGLLPKTSENYNTFNFDTFWVAFLTVFDIVTLDNWVIVLDLLFSASKSKILATFFAVSWIFLGNFALLNLFLAILLDSFTQSLEEEDKEKVLDLEHKELEQEELLEGVLCKRDIQIALPRDARQAFMDELTKEYLKNNSPSKDRKIIEELISETKKLGREESNRGPGFNDLCCENAFFLFSKENWLRILAFKIGKNKSFKGFIDLIICLACFMIILETYFDKKSEESFEKLVIRLIKAGNGVLVAVFGIEIWIKSMIYGFCLERKSFMRSGFNILDFLIVFSYVVDLVFYDEDFGLNMSSVIFLLLY